MFLGREGAASISWQYVARSYARHHSTFKLRYDPLTPQASWYKLAFREFWTNCSYARCFVKRFISGQFARFITDFLAEFSHTNFTSFPYQPILINSFNSRPH